MDYNGGEESKSEDEYNPDVIEFSDAYLQISVNYVGNNSNEKNEQ